MKVQTIVPTVAIALWAVIGQSGAAPSAEVPVKLVHRHPTEPDTAMMLRREYWNDKTSHAWDPERHKERKRVIVDGKPVEETAVARREKRKNGKRASGPWDFGDWHATGFSDTTGKWDWYYTRWTPWCYKTNTKDYFYGSIVRCVVTDGWERTDPGPGYYYWYNDTEKKVSKPSDRASKCFIFSNITTMCSDQLWNPTTAVWEAITTANNDSYWSVGNSSYYNHTVRTRYDCLLMQVVVEYKTIPAAIGYKPVQYKVNSMKYYRWYDANNFAWFAACPQNYPGAYKLRKRDPYKVWGNPIWDFGTNEQQHPNTDRTPFRADQIPNYNPGTSYTAMYWPYGWRMNVTIDGHLCQEMSYSRPGLRHWTARMIEIPDLGYPPITNEVNYPAGWANYSLIYHAVNDYYGGYWTP